MERPPVCQPPIQDAGFAPGRLQVRLQEGSCLSSAGPVGQQLALRESRMRAFNFGWRQSAWLCSPAILRSVPWDYRSPHINAHFGISGCEVWAVARHQTPDSPLDTTALSSRTWGLSGADPLLTLGLARHPDLSPSGQLIPLSTVMDGFRDGQ